MPAKAATRTDTAISTSTGALGSDTHPTAETMSVSEITEAEAEEYREVLEEAFTFRVTWDGEKSMPTFSGLSA